MFWQVFALEKSEDFRLQLLFRAEISENSRLILFSCYLIIPPIPAGISQFLQKLDRYEAKSFCRKVLTAETAVFKRFFEQALTNVYYWTGVGFEIFKFEAVM